MRKKFDLSHPSGLGYISLVFHFCESLIDFSFPSKALLQRLPFAKRLIGQCALMNFFSPDELLPAERRRCARVDGLRVITVPFSYVHRGSERTRVRIWRIKCDIYASRAWSRMRSTWLDPIRIRTRGRWMGEKKWLSPIHDSYIQLSRKSSEESSLRLFCLHFSIECKIRLW